VSSITPSFVSHQSQLRVPPRPFTAALPPRDAYGKFKPLFRSAVLLPAPGGPMIAYQGRK
jgi:hypothetical protein